MALWQQERRQRKQAGEHATLLLTFSLAFCRSGRLLGTLSSRQRAVGGPHPPCRGCRQSRSRPGFAAAQPAVARAVVARAVVRATGMAWAGGVEG